MNGETLNGTLVLAREATLDAVTGLYKVVDPTGVVMAAAGSLIAPGAAGYAEAALRADNLYGGDKTHTTPNTPVKAGFFSCLRCDPCRQLNSLLKKHNENE